MQYLSVLTTLLFLFLGALHLYWAFGGKLGASKAIPEVNGSPSFAPSKIITILVAIVLFCIGGFAYLLGFYSFTNLPCGKYILYCGWLLAIIFAIRAIGEFKLVGFFKKVKGTDFAKYDTLYYSPLCLVLSIIFSVLTIANA